MTAEAVGVVVGQVLCALILLVGIAACIPWVRRQVMIGARAELDRQALKPYEVDDSISRHPAGKMIKDEEGDR